MIYKKQYNYQNNMRKKIKIKGKDKNSKIII